MMKKVKRILVLLSCLAMVMGMAACGKPAQEEAAKVKITFGFTHESHYCSILSHAYIRGIQMRHGISNNESQ